MLSIKEYAQKQRVSYEAVRKQVNRYREELGDHIIKQGKKQFLDEEAEAFLDEKRRGSPIIVLEKAKDDRIEELEDANEKLKEELLRTQKELNIAQKKLIERDEDFMELQNKFLLLSMPEPEEDKEEEPTQLDPEPPKKWWQFWK